MVKTFTAVEDDGATVKITIPAGSGSEKISVPKKIKVAVEGSYVRITDVNNDQYVALYSTVTTPVAGTADLLRIALEAFNDTTSDIVSLPPGTETPSATTVTNSVASPVAAGKVAVTFNTSSDFTGTILGVAREASKEYSFEIKNPGKTLAAIAYTVATGSMIIDVQV